MKEIIFRLPDEAYEHVKNGFTRQLGYQETVVVDGETVANPITPDEFVLLSIRDYCLTIAKREPTEYQLRLAVAQIADLVEGTAAQWINAIEMSLNEV